MKTYKVNKSNCYVYKESEVPPGIEYKEDWRDGLLGEWVKTDDGYVMQILRRFKAGDRECVGTCTGTYIVSPDTTKLCEYNKLRLKVNKTKKDIRDFFMLMYFTQI